MSKIGAPFNSIFSFIIKKRIHQIDFFIKYPADVQRDLLFQLISTAKETEYGKIYDFKSIQSYNDFKNRVPLTNYEEIEPYISKVMKGEQNILWPGKTKWFAKSSGTTNSKSKFIPVTKEALEDCHYKGGKDLLALYYHQHPNTKLYKGKHLILGGSAELNPMNNTQQVSGDLSAIIVNNLPWWCEYRRTPSKEITLNPKWEEKIEKMASTTVDEDVYILAGVPSWTLVLLKRILEKNNTDNISDIWPNLELYMHGGVSFEPYKDQFDQIIRKSNMNYVETYNASEGFFGIQNETQDDDLLLMLDYGIFYEFIPMNEFHKEEPNVISIDEVETGVNYALVISTNAGLWRYVIGDTILFSSLHPYKFKITGRTKHFINVFGEELIVDNTDKAIRAACKKHQCAIVDYTVAPIFMSTEAGGHEWAIEFGLLPESLSDFIITLDESLQRINSDYQAKRTGNLNLKLPKINAVKKGTFYAWLKAKNKLGGQHKIPRLMNDRSLLEELLSLNH